ncbi:MAG: hypothetical protein AB7O28_19375 [Vicinamibacterales bacterium]
MRRARAAIGAALALLVSAAAAGAQARAGAAPAVDPGREVPLQCWWRASKGAIHIGEVVDVTLTCSALESEAARAVPDETRLTVAAVQMAPWEIVGGTHPADIRAGSRRIFQYVYQLRMLEPTAIGRDVRLPPLLIPYRVESRMGADTAMSGRDLTQLMPQTPIRIVGQVPGEASDIRDGSAASLGEIAALRFRADAYRTTGTVLAALAGVSVVAALVPLAGRVRRARVGAPGLASDRAVLLWAAARLDQLARAGAGGWSADAVRDAHATARLVAGVRLGRGVRQRRLSRGEAAPEGRLVVPHGLRRTRSAVTASATAGDVARAVDALGADASAATRASLERLRDALDVLARAQFTRDAAADGTPAGLDEAVRAAGDVARETARERLLAWRPWRRADAAGAPSLEF